LRALNPQLPQGRLKKVATATKRIAKQGQERVGGKGNGGGKGREVKTQQSLRRKVALEGILSGKPKTQALQEAGYSPGYNPTNWSNQPGTQAEITRILEEKELDIYSLLDTAKLLVERCKSSKDNPKVDKNFLDLLNIINKLQGNYAPTRVEEKRLSLSAKIGVEELMSAEERIAYHERALALARKEGGGSGRRSGRK